MSRPLPAATTTSVLALSFLAALAIRVAVTAAAHSAPLSTWTIAAADPASGAVGVAGASCAPMTHVDAIASLVPGKGVAVTQAFWDLDNRNRIFALLKGGVPAVEIVSRVASPLADRSLDDRQYGVVTLRDGGAVVAGFTGKGNLQWSGSVQDRALGLTVQGNILVGPSVVERAREAFQTRRGPQNDTLADRLMRALEAGSAQGGDARCNNGRVRQTAASAFILVAQPGDPAYAAADLGVTDQGTSKAPWLAISVTLPQFGENPVVELRKRFDGWKKTRAR